MKNRSLFTVHTHWGGRGAQRIHPNTRRLAAALPAITAYNFWFLQQLPAKKLLLYSTTHKCESKLV